jgi:hypothetical protein
MFGNRSGRRMHVWVAPLKSKKMNVRARFFYRQVTPNGVWGQPQLCVLGAGPVKGSPNVDTVWWSGGETGMEPAAPG